MKRNYKNKWYALPIMATQKITPILVNILFTVAFFAFYICLIVHDLSVSMSYLTDFVWNRAKFIVIPIIAIIGFVHVYLRPRNLVKNPEIFTYLSNKGELISTADEIFRKRFGAITLDIALLFCNMVFLVYADNVFSTELTRVTHPVICTLYGPSICTMIALAIDLFGKLGDVSISDTMKRFHKVDFY